MLRTLNMFHHTPYNNNDTSYNAINNHDMGNAIAHGREENGSLKGLAGSSFHNCDIQSHSLTDVHNNDNSEQHQNQQGNVHDNHNSNDNDNPVRINEEEGNGNEEEEIIVEEEEIIEYADEEEEGKSGHELAMISSTTEGDDVSSNVPTKGSSSVAHDDGDDIEIIVEEEVVEEETNGEIEGKEQHQGTDLETIDNNDIQRQHHITTTWNDPGSADSKRDGFYEIDDSVTAMNNHKYNNNRHDQYNTLMSQQGKRARTESEASSKIGDEVELTSFEHAGNGDVVVNKHQDKDSIENESTHSADGSSKRRKTDDIRQRSHSQSTIDDELADSKIGNDKSVHRHNININKILNGDEQHHHIETEKSNNLLRKHI